MFSDPLLLLDIQDVFSVFAFETTSTDWELGQGVLGSS